MMKSFICVLVILLSVCSAQDTGRVFIGQRNSNVTLTSLTFRETSTTATVPVYIDVFRFNTVTNTTDVVPVTGNVLVTCEVTIQQTGYSSATFSSITATNANKDGTISLSNLNSGRQANIQCFGESQQAGVTQFSRAASLSSALPLTINNLPSITLYPSRITTEVTSFSVLLLLEAPSTTGTVGIRCQADKINSTTVVNQVLQNPLCFSTPTATVTTMPSTTPGTTVVTPGWDILDPVLQLSPSNGQFSSVLKVARNMKVTSAIREYVVISCCSSNLGINISDSVLAVARLKPNVTENWDQATAAASTEVERTIQNPAYSEVAPCACDLTGNLCDIGCCCDQDCANLSSVFSSCIPGLVGGQGAATPEYRCTSNHFNKEDWFVFMCVQWEYNSLLGFFYSTEPAIRKEESFNTKLTGEQYYSYSEAELRTPSYNNFGNVGYKYGSAVQSVKIGNIGVDSIGLVALPQKVLSGECLSTAPVQYLKNFKTDCTVQLTENICSVTGGFNSLFYVISTSANNPAYSGLYGILDTPINQRISNVSVNYHCTTDFTGYIKSTVSSSTSPTGNYTFNYTLPTGNCADTCGNDICASQDSMLQSTSLPPRCWWDDGTSMPPEVLFNAGSSTCQNAVLDVKYHIYWTGTEITRLDAFVIMGNISVASSPEVTQKYEAVFIHELNGNTTTLDNFLSLVNTSYNRSGSPGYDFEKPIWSGSPIYNSTTGELIRIETNSARQIALWNTGIDGLCFNAGRRAVMFGEDTFTSCNLRMGLYEFSDCDKLRSLIINRVNNLMKSVYIGRFGYNDPTNTNYWITVQREDLTDICLGNYNQSDMDILTYTMQGMCTNMITGINLDIMYAETGRRNDAPIHEIIGAKISYPKSTWKLTCATGGACSGSRYVESFPVTSSVQFIKVPGNTPARVEKWEENYDTSLCGQDVCWEELLYPLSSSYTADSRNYVLAVTLVLIIIFMAFLLITRPWW